MQEQVQPDQLGTIRVISSLQEKEGISLVKGDLCMQSVSEGDRGQDHRGVADKGDDAYVG